jgi:hypothetical protein
MAGLRLSGIGLAKAFDAIIRARALDLTDPLVGISFVQLVLMEAMEDWRGWRSCLSRSTTSTDRRRMSLLACGAFPRAFLCTGSFCGLKAGTSPATTWAV